MLENLKQNISQEKKIISDLNALQQGMQGKGEHEQFYMSSFPHNRMSHNSHRI